MTTVTQPQPTQQSQQSQPDKLEGQFNSQIGLPPQSQNPDYLRGYFDSNVCPF